MMCIICIVWNTCLILQYAQFVCYVKYLFLFIYIYICTLRIICGWIWMPKHDDISLFDGSVILNPHACWLRTCCGASFGSPHRIFGVGSGPMVSIHPKAIYLSESFEIWTAKLVSSTWLLWLQITICKSIVNPNEQSMYSNMTFAYFCAMKPLSTPERLTLTDNLQALGNQIHVVAFFFQGSG